jgi:hypothetical protein
MKNGKYYGNWNKYQVRLIDAAEIDVVEVHMRIDLAVIKDILAPISLSL